MEEIVFDLDGVSDSIREAFERSAARTQMVGLINWDAWANNSFASLGLTPSRRVPIPVSVVPVPWVRDDLYRPLKDNETSISIKVGMDDVYDHIQIFPLIEILRLLKHRQTCRWLSDCKEEGGTTIIAAYHTDRAVRMCMVISRLSRVMAHLHFKPGGGGQKEAHMHFKSIQ